MIMTPQRSDAQSMEMTFQEYCAWYFHRRALKEIFGLDEIFLPPQTEILEYAIIKEGYEHPSLYEFLLDDHIDEEELLNVVRELNIDVTFPNLRQTAITICRYIASQETAITKNLSSGKRDFIVSTSVDYSILQSVFTPLTQVFSLSFAKDLNIVPPCIRPYVCYFESIRYENEYFNDPLFKEVSMEIANLNLPDEYLDIYEILIEFYADNLTVQKWIEEEARIVDLAKVVYQKLIK